MYRITIALVIFGVCLAGMTRAADDSAGAAGDLKQVCHDSVVQISRGDAKGFVPLWHRTAAPPPADEQDKVARSNTEELQKSAGAVWRVSGMRVRGRKED